MIKQTRTDAIKALDDLLEEERLAALSGNITKIAALADAKEKLTAQINENASDNSKALSDLKYKMKRNQSLLQAVMQGVQRVTTRLAMLRHMCETLDIYDANGRKRILNGTMMRDVEKRA